MSAISLPIPVVTIGDHGGDPDDEYLLVALAAYQRLGLVDLRAVVANEHPAAARAALAEGARRQLGLQVPVGVGADNVGRTKEAAAFDAPYAHAAPRSDGRALLIEALQAAEPRSVHLLLTSAVTDAGWLLANEPELCRDRLAAVTMMSGASFDEDERRWVPDTATNNTADLPAAQELFATLQQREWRHVKVQVLTRRAVYHGSKIPPTALSELAAGGHPVAVWLRERAEVALNRMWLSANYPPGHPERGTLPANRDRRWFVENRSRRADRTDARTAAPRARRQLSR